VVVFAVHAMAHAVPEAQPKLFGQAAGVPGVQVPVPLHVPVGVSIDVAALHETAPQVVPLGGKWHAPVLVQLSAPQAMPMFGHAEGPVQQLPVPFTPQMVLAHAALLPQDWPFESRQAVPPALQV
jgi:hypothetical protein